ncbi:hypothetical protein EJB05_56966, partial [Eragrostis curvula]
MAASRRRSGGLLVPVSVALAVLVFLAGAATAKKTGQLTVFWGRNKNEGTLREACDTGLYNTVIISFYSVFGHGRYWGDLSGHPLAGVGDDIKHCQSRNILSSTTLEMKDPVLASAASRVRNKRTLNVLRTHVVCCRFHGCDSTTDRRKSKKF